MKITHFSSTIFPELLVFYLFSGTKLYEEQRMAENRSLRLRMLLTEALNQRHSEKVPSDEDLESPINTRESEEREGPV